MIKSRKSDFISFLAISFLFSLYALIFIFKTSFDVNGTRVFSLFDDAMISMRYAENLVHGHGLVMNPGERVEGYTNPLWVIYMAFIHLLPIAKEKISLLIQLTGALILIMNLFAVMKLSRLIDENSEWFPSAAMFLTAFYLPLINWSLQGMEVSLAALFTTAATYWAIVLYRKKEFSPWIFLMLGAGTLLRIDLTVIYIGAASFLIYALPEHRRNNIRWGIILLAVFLFGQTILRYLYYGDILPNTYYLKMTGYPLFFRITRGFNVFVTFLWNMNIILFLFPFAVLAWRFSLKKGFLAYLFGLQCLYSIYVGGDAWEIWSGSNRYISIVMPLFFILFAYSLKAVVSFLLDSFKKPREAPGKFYKFSAQYALTILIIVSFLSFNSNKGPLSLAGFVFINNPANYEGQSSVTRYAYIIKQISKENAKIAVTWAGSLPYFSERYSVDILGKTDKYLAKMKMHRAEGFRELTYFYPGHLKWDYAYSFGQQKPDIIVQFWEDADSAWPYVKGLYTKLVVGNWFFYLRNGSPEIYWDRLPPMALQSE